MTIEERLSTIRVELPLPKKPYTIPVLKVLEWMTDDQIGKMFTSYDTVFYILLDKQGRYETEDLK